MNADPVTQIRRTLESSLAPTHLHIEDESWKHAGHTGSGGGGHFVIEITAEAFRGKSRIERHRMVYAPLKTAFGPAIHALSIRARSPDEPADTAERPG